MRYRKFFIENELILKISFEFRIFVSNRYQFYAIFNFNNDKKFEDMFDINILKKI